MADTLVFVLRYGNEKICSAQADLNRWHTSRPAKEHLSDYDVIKVTNSKSQSFYFGLDASSFRPQKSEELWVNGLYASKLGINNNDTVSANLLSNVPACIKAWIEPVTVDDWEILEIHAAKIERSLLDQIRVLWPGQVFPLWVTNGVCIFLRTVAIEPSTQCGVLMPLTELIVEPKIYRNASRETDIMPHRLDTKSTDMKSKDASLDAAEKNCPASPLAPPILTEYDSAIPESDSLSLPQKLIQIWIVQRLISIAKYVLNLFFRKFFPSILEKFSFLRVTSVSEHGCESSNTQLLPAILSKINDFPSKFNLVLRIEDTQPSRNWLFEKYDQAGYALLSYSNQKSTSNSEDYRLFLVSIQKLPSGNQIENEFSTMDIRASDFVVRLCVQSMSKFAMFLRNDGKNDGLKVNARSLKLSPVLRMQHKIGITSKVRLRKLDKTPKSASHNVKAMFLQVLKQAQDIGTEFDYKKSFEDWIRIVSDEENPLPVSVGSIFLLTVRKSIQDVETGVNLCSDVHVRIQKIVDQDGKVSNDYFLFSYKDLSFVHIDFLLEPFSGVVLDEIDPKIPSESTQGLIPCQSDIILQCMQHCDRVFRSKPISHKLVGDTCHPGNILILGPSGIGKSYLSRALLRKLATLPEEPVYVRWISCANLKGKKPETIKKMLLGIAWELQWRQPSALLLDNLDHLVVSGKNSVDGDSSPTETYMLQLASLIKDVFSMLAKTSGTEANKIIVVATARSEQAVHPVLLPAQGCYMFTKICELTLPDKIQRSQYMKAILLKKSLINTQSLSKVNFEKVAGLTEGYCPRDYEQLFKRASICSRQRSNWRYDSTLKTSDVVKAAIGFVPISLQDANLNLPQKFSWNDVGGLEKVRRQLTEKLIWPMKYSHLYQNAGMQLRSGVLLYGPPGCGKTLLAGVIANECNLNFISVKGPEVLNKYIGASEAAVRELFNRASAAAPCLLFFDEFDSLAQKRGHDNTGVTDRVVNQFLTHLDGIEPLAGVYVLAATSRPDLIDPAILRPGRLDTHLYCPMPDFDERCRILQCLLKKVALLDEVNIHVLAAKCQHFTGADLRALVYDAQLKALHGDTDMKISSDKSDCGSALTVPSRSMTPSSLEMELDDQYNTNGFQAAQNDILDESVLSSGSESSLTVQDFTKTAARLAKSLQERNWKSAKSGCSGQYQFCYSLSPTHQVESKFNHATETTACSNVIHFPSLYSKTDSTSFPESVRNIVDTIKITDTCHDVTQRKHESRSILVGSHHFYAALDSATPSVSESERQRFTAICDNFLTGAKSDRVGDTDIRRQKKTTLA